MALQRRTIIGHIDDRLCRMLFIQMRISERLLTCTKNKVIKRRQIDER